MRVNDFQVKVKYALSIVVICMLFSFNDKLQIDTKPELEFSKKYVDFGLIKTDTLLKADFWLKNPGNTILNIIDIDPDCTCTSFDFENYSIAPLDSSLLTLYFDTKNKVGKHLIYTVIEANTEVKFYKLTIKVDIQR